MRDLLLLAAGQGRILITRFEVTTTRCYLTKEERTLNIFTAFLASCGEPTGEGKTFVGPKLQHIIDGAFQWAVMAGAIPAEWISDEVVS